jgi:hypothetical protein
MHVSQATHKAKAKEKERKNNKLGASSSGAALHHFPPINHQAESLANHIHSNAPLDPCTPALHSQMSTLYLKI